MMTYFTVRFGVADSLVDDGFVLTDDMIKRMIENAIPHSDTYQTSADLLIDDTDFDVEYPPCDFPGCNSARLN